MRCAWWVVLISFAVVFIPILGIHGCTRSRSSRSLGTATADAVGTTVIPRYRESTTVSPEASGRTLPAQRENVKPKHLKLSISNLTDHYGYCARIHLRISCVFFAAISAGSSIRSRAPKSIAMGVRLSFCLRSTRNWLLRADLFT